MAQVKKNEPFTNKTVDSIYPDSTVLHLIWGGRGRVIKGADYLRYAKRMDAPEVLMQWLWLGNTLAVMFHA